jgi:hypothetical protein
MNTPSPPDALVLAVMLFAVVVRFEPEVPMVPVPDEAVN